MYTVLLKWSAVRNQRFRESNYLLFIAINPGTIDVSVPSLHDPETIRYWRFAKGKIDGLPPTKLKFDKEIARLNLQKQNNTKGIIDRGIMGKNLKNEARGEREREW